jgi:hypothetical protein
LKITRCHRLRTLQEDTAVMRALTPQVAPADLLCRSYTKLNEASCSPSALGFSLSSLPNFTRALPGHTRRRAPVWRPRRGGGHGQRGGGGVPTRYKQAGANARRDGASHAGGWRMQCHIMCCRVLPRALTRGLRGTTTAMPPRAVAFLYVSFDPRVS